MAKRAKPEKQAQPPEVLANPTPEPKYVRGFGIVLLSIYLVAFTLLLLYCLLRIWPSEGAVELADEVRLILIVLLSGALGSMVHALRSFFWYVGNRMLVRSWIMKYILLPFSGSTLGLMFYLVLRAGLFSPEASVNATSAFGFAGVAGLVGMFSEQAVEKLKEVASTLFEPAKIGEDHAAPEGETE
ncbi:MAG: hypothetical protein ISS57_00930 [Anaerolineales bacterium]|nr:hypothetical protein [Chloroflexota bacterium]MBL7161139.1 hypothetical protein [Anaerolineales bacterium]